MKFRSLLLAFALPFALSASDRPNVILMMADDLGWADVGFNGGTTIATPHLDAMAASGVVMERFYAAAPVCSPTRGSVLTGRHPYRYGIPYANTGHLKSQEQTLAELLGQAGYQTGHFGKWHLGTLTKTVKDANRGGPRGVAHYSPPQANGFQVCFSTESKVPTWDPMRQPVSGGSSKGWNALAESDEGNSYGTRYWNEEGEEVRENLRGDDSRVIVDRVVPFLEESVAAEQPFFAVVWFHTPHLPVVAGPRYFAMYPDAQDDFHRNYSGSVTAMDEQIGRIRETLRELGVAENTLLAFASDNGPEGDEKDPGRAEPFRGRKRSLYEGGVRVPGVIEWPARLAQGTRTKTAISTHDYLPTVANLVGAMVTAREIDGVDLLPLLAGEPRKSGLGFQSQDQAAWHEGAEKVYRPRKSAPWELYNLAADPGETQDLAAASPEKVSEMAKRFEQWEASCAASNRSKVP